MSNRTDGGSPGRWRRRWRCGGRRWSWRCRGRDGGHPRWRRGDRGSRGFRHIGEAHVSIPPTGALVLPVALFGAPLLERDWRVVAPLVPFNAEEGAGGGGGQCRVPVTNIAVPIVDTTPEVHAKRADPHQHAPILASCATVGIVITGYGTAHQAAAVIGAAARCIVHHEPSNLEPARPSAVRGPPSGMGRPVSVALDTSRLVPGGQWRGRGGGRRRRGRVVTGGAADRAGLVGADHRAA